MPLIVGGKTYKTGREYSDSQKKGSGASPAPTPSPTPAPSTQSRQTDLISQAESGALGTNMQDVAKKYTTPTPTDTTTGESTYYPRYTQNEQQASNYLNTFQAPQSVEEIQQEKMRSAREEINGLNSYYNSRLQEQSKINQSNERAVASVNTLTGLAGSSEANVTTARAKGESQQANDKILAEKQMELGGILSAIRTSAQTEATAQKTEARLSAEQVMTQRKASMEEAVTNTTTLAKSGVTVDGLKATDPETYAYLAQKVGGEAQLKAMFTLNRPQETILDKRVEGGSYVIAYQNPLDGKIRVETIDLGLPPDYSKSVDLGDQMMFIPKDFNPNDPNSSQPIYVSKGMSPDQEADNEIAWYNATTGRINANKSGTGGSGSLNSDGSVSVSPEAQNIIDLINKGENMDDLIKGSSIVAQRLRNEVTAGLVAQGGYTEQSRIMFQDGLDAVREFIANQDYKKLGGYSSKLGGQLTAGYGDAKQRAGQILAIVTRDNLGLMKGVLTDTDRDFLQRMSTGFAGEGLVSEQYVKDQIEKIGKKFEERLSGGEGAVKPQGGGTTQMKGPDGNLYEVPNDQVDAFIADGGSRA